MTNIDKRIDEIMDISETSIDYHDREEALHEACEIIKHLQAQLVERDNEIKHLKATLGAIQSLCCQFEGGVTDAIKEFIQTGEVK